MRPPPRLETFTLRALLRWAVELSAWLQPFSRITGAGGVRVSESPGALIICGADSSSAPVVSSWRFISANDTTRKVKIGGGLVLPYARVASQVSETEVEVAGGTSEADVTYVWIKGKWDGSGFAIQAKTTATIPHHSVDYFEAPLHSFYINRGTVVHVRQHRFGDIDLLGIHAHT